MNHPSDKGHYLDHTKRHKHSAPDPQNCPPVNKPMNSVDSSQGKETKWALNIFKSVHLTAGVVIRP